MSFSLRLLPIAAVFALTMPAAAEERQTDSKGEQPPVATEANPPPTEAASTMRELLNAGYEIKTATVVPEDVVKRAGSTTSVDATFIILQKGPLVATCYTVFSSLVDGTLASLPCTVYK